MGSPIGVEPADQLSTPFGFDGTGPVGAGGWDLRPYADGVPGAEYVVMLHRETTAGDSILRTRPDQTEGGMSAPDDRPRPGDGPSAGALASVDSAQWVKTAWFWQGVRAWRSALHRRGQRWPDNAWMSERLMLGSGGLRPFGPWFHQRPRLARAVVALLYVAVAVGGLSEPADRSVIAVAVVLPISLSAMTFGRWGGVTAGLAGMALFAMWAFSGRPSGLGIEEWVGAGALLLLGALLGDAVDGMEASELRTMAAEAARLQAELIAGRHRQATEINDGIVQGVAVAKWALEAGDVSRALELLDETVGAGQRLVSDLMGNDTPFEGCFPIGDEQASPGTTDECRSGGRRNSSLTTNPA
jgi:hypothetical protein